MGKTYERHYNKEYKKRRSLQLSISVPSRIFTIIQKRSNPNMSSFICNAIEYFDRKHKDPHELLKELFQRKKSLVKEAALIDEKREDIENFIKKRKKKK